MNNYQFNSLEDFINCFCNSFNTNNNNNDCSNCQFGNKNAEASLSSRLANSDIPGGFQNANPQLLLIFTTLLGGILAERMPFNVQNAVGNWLELLGQTIIAYNAQQQYFQGGPGRLYSPIYRNASNPFCSTSTDESQKNSSSTQESNPPTSTSKKSATINSNNFTTTNEELHNEIAKLKIEIEKLKNLYQY